MSWSRTRTLPLFAFSVKPQMMPLTLITDPFGASNSARSSLSGRETPMLNYRSSISNARNSSGGASDTTTFEDKRSVREMLCTCYGTSLSVSLSAMGGST